MYYALDVRRHISTRIPWVWSQTARKAFIPSVGEKKSSRNAGFATNKNPDWRSGVSAYWTCVGSVDCFRLRTVGGEENIATNEPDLPAGVSPRSYPAC